MYSLEERTKAVKLYNESTVIRILGYPSPNALRSWYTEYLSNGQLHTVKHHAVEQLGFYGKVLEF